MPKPLPVVRWFALETPSASDGGLRGASAHHRGGVRGAGTPGTHLTPVHYAPPCPGGSCAEGCSAKHWFRNLPVGGRSAAPIAGPAFVGYALSVHLDGIRS